MAGTQVDLIRERTDIVDLIGQRVQLRQAGRSLKGLCPFHNEKTPSFVVYPESQHFHCFGCGKSGDAFSFLMAIDNLDFRDALRTLAEKAGVELEARVERKDPERDHVRDRLIDLNERAAAYFGNALWNTDSGQTARSLLDRRGVDRKTAERFGLGFAPDSFDSLKRFFTSRDIEPAQLVDAGLLIAREDGHTWDRFRNRLMFPIRDREGRTLGFGARAIGDDHPKYLNSPETAIFDKSSMLYALDKAYDEVRRQRALVIVEGYMDAIAAHQFGFNNVVASMGTAVTTAQVSAIRRYVDRVYLALDADVAGQLASLRGIDALRDGLAEESRPAVSGRGIVRFERTIGAEVRIVVIQAGKDPDELIRADISAWRSALESAVPLVEYYLTRTLADVEPTPAARARALQEVAVPLLREIPDASVLAQYMGLTARLLGFKDTDVHAAILRGSVVPGRTPADRPTSLRPEDRPVAHDPERYLFALILRYWEIAKSSILELDPNDVLDARNQIMLQALASEQGTIDDLRQSVPPELQEHLDTLEVELADRPSHTPGAAYSEVLAATRRLAHARHAFRVRQVQAEIQGARANGDTEQVIASLQRMTELASRQSRFDPNESPYFKDTRSETG